MQSCIRGDDRLVTPVFEQLHSEGAVVTRVSNMLLPEETAHLIDKGKQVGLRRSTVVGTGSGVHDSRTSSTAFLKKGSDPVTKCIENRIATLAGMPRAHMEPMQITDYTHKQQYKAHHDYLRQGNAERTTTVFAYLADSGLRDGTCGGATAFFKLNGNGEDALRVYPKAGDAVMWSNRTLTGGLNDKTLHAGEPLTCANTHKVGLNVWFRDQPWK
tara:strand:- start:985 stop:1629 length:645 start_codon:yes stop_codon:yes gene_type:complete